MINIIIRYRKDCFTVRFANSEEWIGSARDHEDAHRLVNGYYYPIICQWCNDPKHQRLA
jgi:hypothetical protein